jgi:type II secretory pathway pseudopilin PulG
MQNIQRPQKCRRGQWSLVGILVSLAVIAILSAWYYNKILKPQAGSHNGAPAAEQKAYGSVCSVYQSQINQAVMMYKSDHNDRSPQSFEALKKYGATDDIVKAQGCQFQLDASTGAVTDIGHGEAAPNAQPVVVGGASAAPATNAPGPYWQSAPPSSQPGASNPQPAPATGPGGIRLPPGASTVPADGGGE